MALPKNILDIINSNKTSLGDNPALPPELDEKFLVFLVNKHYKELLTHFDNINVNELSQDLSKTMTECKKLEANNKEALEQLCSNIVNELFQIPSDTILINMQIVDTIDTNQERLVPEKTTDYSFEDIDEMNHVIDEIYKRRFLNALIIGAAMFYSENINIYAEELNRIDSRLIHLYKKILCINNLLLFHTKENISRKHKDGGRVDVYISDETMPVRIEAQGLIFPILLQETIKGILELAIAHGLPTNRERAKYIMSKTDFKLAEIWDQRLGLPLWKRFNSVITNIGKNVKEIGLNFILMEISMLNTSQFNEVMQQILAHTNVGKQLLLKLSDKILYQKEQDDFDEYITNMQQVSQYPITDDGEFTSDELINDDLCASSILDETDY